MVTATYRHSVFDPAQQRGCFYYPLGIGTKFHHVLANLCHKFHKSKENWGGGILLIVPVLLILLRLPYRNDAEIAKFCNFWTFWPVIQPISHLSNFWTQNRTTILNGLS